MNVKPGWKTSEFWLHALAAVAVSGITYLEAHASGLPPVAQGIVPMVGPLAIAWIAKNYGDSRADVKNAAMAAAQAASASPQAAAKALGQ